MESRLAGLDKHTTNLYWQRSRTQGHRLFLVQLLLIWIRLGKKRSWNRLHFDEFILFRNIKLNYHYYCALYQILSALNLHFTFSCWFLDEKLDLLIGPIILNFFLWKKLFEENMFCRRLIILECFHSKLSILYT